MSAAAVRSLVRAARPDEAALLAAVAVGDEPAFAELVRRHGPMTLGVCRRVLGPTADADDAFQHTFLALAKHAKSVRTPAALPGWLHRTALRAAHKIKARSPKAAVPPEPAVTPDPLADLSWKEVRAALDAELNALPDRLRGPLVLCYLDGRTRDDAAAALGVSLSTLKRRIADGLDRLNRRLTRRGVAGVGLAAAVLSGHGLTAAVPAELVRKATTAFGALPAAGFVSILVGWKAAVVLVALVGLTAAGVTLLAQPQPVKAPPPKEEKATAKTDLFGDPLPEGAVLRLGTTALRPPGVLGMTFRKNGDLATLSSDGAIRVWPADGSPKATVQPMGINKDTNWYAVCSPDLRYAASSTWRSPKNTLVVWDLSGEKATEYLAQPFQSAYRYAFSPDGNWLAVYNYDAAGKKPPFHLCHLPTKTWVELDSNTGPHHLEALVFSPDGKRLVTAFGSEAVVIDVAEKKEIQRVKIAQGRQADAAFSPDGKTLAVLYTTWLFGGNPTVRLFSVESGEETAKFDLSDKATRWVRFTPDGTSVCTGGRDGYREWDAATFKPTHEVTGSCDRPAVYSADGRWAAWANGAVIRYDRKAGRMIRPDLIDGGHTGGIMGITLSPDAKVIATYAMDGEIRTWDAATGKPLGRVQSSWWNGSRLVFLSDSKSLVTVADDYQTPAEYDATTGKELRRFAVPADKVKGFITADLRLSADGKTLTAEGTPASSDKKACTVRWDIASGRVLEVTESKEEWTKSDSLPPVVSPDGRWTVQNGQATRVGDTTPVQIVPLSDTSSFPARFTPDSRFVALPRAPFKVAADLARGHLVVYDLVAKATHAELPTGRPHTYVFAPDGRTVLVAARTPEREETALWELASGKKAWGVPGAHGGNSQQTPVFTPDGRRVITADGCTALVWDITGKRTGDTPAKLWDALAGEATAAHRAGWELTDRPADAVPLIREKVKPAQAADAAAVAALVAKLGDRDFAEREAAERALRQLGAAAKPALEAAVKGELSAEQAERAGRIVAAVGKPITPTGAALRELRAVAVLERVGSADARKVLEALAGGLPDARLTQEAKAALGRLR